VTDLLGAASLRSREDQSMISDHVSRRVLSVRLASSLSGLGMAGMVVGSTGGPSAEDAAGNEGLLHKAESIHQEVVFKASRRRVYDALTDAEQFGKVTGDPATRISREAGGAFSCFGGRIVGRHVELVPSERIVQAWRVSSWDPGLYSIVMFQLKEQASQTRLVFDHRGFPDGKGEHLAAGWKTNYWRPLEKYLA
jgi:activator of HSP90 ATPase